MSNRRWNALSYLSNMKYIRIRVYVCKRGGGAMFAEGFLFWRTVSAARQWSEAGTMHASACTDCCINMVYYVRNVIYVRIICMYLLRSMRFCAGKHSAAACYPPPLSSFHGRWRGFLISLLLRVLYIYAFIYMYIHTTCILDMYSCMPLIRAYPIFPRSQMKKIAPLNTFSTEGKIPCGLFLTDKNRHTDFLALF